MCSVLPKKLPPKAKMSSYIIEKSNQYVTVYNQLTHDGHCNHNKHWVVHFWTCSPWESQEEIKNLVKLLQVHFSLIFFRVTLAIMYNNYSQSNVLFWTLIARVALTQLNKAGFCESLEAPAQRTMVVICNFRPKIMIPILIKNLYTGTPQSSFNAVLLYRGILSNAVFSRPKTMLISI